MSPGCERGGERGGERARCHLQLPCRLPQLELADVQGPCHGNGGAQQQHARTHACSLAGARAPPLALHLLPATATRLGAPARRLFPQVCSRCPSEKPVIRCEQQHEDVQTGPTAVQSSAPADVTRVARICSWSAAPGLEPATATYGQTRDVRKEESYLSLSSNTIVS